MKIAAFRLPFETFAIAETIFALDPLDFLALDGLLDEEERAIRDTVRAFVREKVLPDVGDWFEQGILPRELIAELGKLGLFGMHLDGYGLPGASSVMRLPSTPDSPVCEAKLAFASRKR